MPLVNPSDKHPRRIRVPGECVDAWTVERAQPLAFLLHVEHAAIERPGVVVTNLRVIIVETRAFRASTVVCSGLAHLPALALGMFSSSGTFSYDPACSGTALGLM